MHRVKGAVYGAISGLAGSLALGLLAWLIYFAWATVTYGGLAMLRDSWDTMLFGALVAFSVWWWYPLLASALGAAVGAWRAGR